MDIIKYYTYDDYDKLVITKYLKSDISFMDFKKDSIAYKKEYDRYRVEAVQKKDSTTYSLYGIDNGIYQHYVFKKKHDKWYLTSIHDYSD